jgi:hypothetical protein
VVRFHVEAHEIDSRERKTKMRQFQMVVFGVGVAAFLGSALCIGSTMGDTLWRTGVAMMLCDIVCIQLWPPLKRP